KNYGNLKALTNLNVKVRSGTVFGILGPNGSGKTTTLGILVGVLNASSGTFSWFGNGQADANRRRIGTLLETPNFYPYLNAIQNLEIVSKIKRVEFPAEEIEKVLRSVGLYSRRTSEFRSFSLGMKQRLAIASALLGGPDVLVLDEPTNGLDPQGIAEIRALIIKIAKEGKTIIVASHQLDEIEKICNRVLILKNGLTLKESGIDELTDKKRQIAIAATDLKELEKLVLQIDGAKIAKSTHLELLVEVPESFSAAAINQFCFDNGVVLNSLKEIQKSLEDQFLEIVQ
ncbi:MAG: ABC-type multidrug transport system ATPase subunit, partial [Crocinitomix sp.]